MLKIPKNHLNFLKTIDLLSEEERAKILEALLSIDSTDALEGYIKIITDRTDIDREKSTAVFTIASSIINTVAGLNQPKSEILDELMLSAKNDIEQFDPKSETRGFLDAITDDPNLKITLKCERLKFESESILESAKVITDLRPIFSEDGKDIQSTVLINTLCLEFFKNDRINSTHISLSEADINEMIGTLERAKIKISALNEFIARKQK